MQELRACVVYDGRIDLKRGSLNTPMHESWSGGPLWSSIGQSAGDGFKRWYGNAGNSNTRLWSLFGRTRN